MSFAPGQFITAQRLNRLQNKTYWVVATGTLGSSVTGVDVPGATMSVTIETDGATVSFAWSASFYATGVMGGLASCRPFIGSDGATIFTVAEWKTSAEKGTGAQFWQTVIPTAGTYTCKLIANTPTNTTLAVYTSLRVDVQEVA